MNWLYLLYASIRALSSDSGSAIEPGVTDGGLLQGDVINKQTQYNE